MRTLFPRYEWLFPKLSLTFYEALLEHAIEFPDREFTIDWFDLRDLDLLFLAGGEL
jgi:hypothetical protein